MSQPRSSASPIAIIGMSGRFPGARDLDAFWANVRAGIESLDTFTDDEMTSSGLDRATISRANWVKRGTVLEGADLFDASFFGYSPREAQIIDPQQRVFLETAWEALENAGYITEPDGTSIGVFAGSSIPTYIISQLLADPELVASVGGYQLMLGNDKDFLTTRVSYKLDLHGPSMAVQTACSTSLVAVQVAVRALQRAECDIALAGGVSITFPQRMGYQYQEGMIFSPDATCRPFDSEARGTRSGAGVGIVVLKRLDEAIADRDTIHAVILGAAINNDGAAKAGYTAPSVDGQLEVIATAQALGGVDPRTIGYIEAHGTGTPLGDPIEIGALTRAFRAGTQDTEFCAIGSVKANIGHLDAAAGVTGLIKSVLALEHAELPPLVHFKSANPQLALGTSPFRVPTEAEPWRRGETPRRAAVSSFGIGGTNAHVVLEEAPESAEAVARRDRQVLIVSAKTPDALERATKNLADDLRAQPEKSLAKVAYTLQVGRREFAHRRAVIANDATEAISALTQPERPPVLTAVHEGSARPVAFLFSGQGSQHSGMGRELYEREPVFREAFDRCAELLRPHLDRDLHALRDAEASVVNETRYTQPLLFATEYALASLWMSWGIEPRAMLGHSIGEYVAAHLAGVFSLEDALTVVAARGRLMQSAQPGDMLAVSLGADELSRRLAPGIEIAAVNAPALCTVSGERAAIASFAADLAKSGIEHRSLHTSHAFHSAMMEPVLGSFRDVVAKVRLSAPTRRYLSNVTGTWIQPEQATSPDYYVQHLRRAVQFAAGVKQLAAEQCVLLEVGPGNALTSLARLTLGREGSALAVASMPHPKESRTETDTTLSAVARMWTLGVTVDWEGLHAGEHLGRVPLPTYPFDRKRHWFEPRRSTTQAIAQSTERALGNDARLTPDAIAAARRDNVDDWFYSESWLRLPLTASTARLDDETWLVFGDDDALSGAVRERLAALGAQVVSVERGEMFRRVDTARFAVRPQERDDYSLLLRDVQHRAGRLAGAVHLWNVGDDEQRTNEGDAFYDLATFAGALSLSAADAHLRVVVATSGAQSVGQEMIERPDRAMLTGVTLVLPEEHEGVIARLVDVDPSSTASAQQLVDEALATDGEAIVARRGTQRWVRRHVQTPLSTAPRESLPLRNQGMYLVTGGLGAIGLTVGEWLAREASARVLLTARTALPSRDSWDRWLAEHGAADATSDRIRAIRRIEDAGGSVRIAIVDTADAAAMENAVAEAERAWGPLTGIVHAAGIAGEGIFAAATRDSTSAVLRAKVDGLNVLTDLFGTRSLDFVVLLSSVNAAVGTAGAGAYSAANAYLDAFANSSRAPSGWNTVSIAYTAWSEIGMATKVVVPAAMQEARRAFVAAGIPPRDGVDSMARLLASGLNGVLVSPFDVEATLTERRRVLRARRQAPVSPIADETPKTAFEGMSFDADSIEAQVASVWADLLGVDSIGPDENFFELGGHSLLATRVLARVFDTFGVQIPLRTLFEAPTVRQLAAIIASRVEPASVAVDGDREEIEL